MTAICYSMFLLISFLSLLGQNYSISNTDYAIALKSHFFILSTNDHDIFSNYFEALSLNNNNSPVNGPIDKEDLVNKGDALNRQGNYTGAISLYDNALRIDPNYVNALDGKGWALIELGNYSESLPYFNKALTIDPNYKWSLSNKGWALIELGNYSESLPYFNKALTIDPNLVDALNFKGQALYYLGNISGAKYFINKAIQIDPENKLLKTSLQKLNLNKN